MRTEPEIRAAYESVNESIKSIEQKLQLDEIDANTAKVVLRDYQSILKVFEYVLEERSLYI
jgi:hypothetical protein